MGNRDQWQVDCSASSYPSQSRAAHTPNPLLEVRALAELLPTVCLPHPREDSRMHVRITYIPHTATHTYMYHIHCAHYTQSHHIPAYKDTPHITIHIYTIHHTYIPHTHIHHTIHMPDMYEHHSHIHTKHIPHYSHINIQVQKLGPWPLQTPMHQGPTPGFPDTRSFLLRDLFSTPSLFLGILQVDQGQTNELYPSRCPMT